VSSRIILKVDYGSDKMDFVNRGKIEIPSVLQLVFQVVNQVIVALHRLQNLGRRWKTLALAVAQVSLETLATATPAPVWATDLSGTSWNAYAETVHTDMPFRALPAFAAACSFLADTNMVLTLLSCGTIAAGLLRIRSPRERMGTTFIAIVFTRFGNDLAVFAFVVRVGVEGSRFTTFAVSHKVALS